MQLPVMLVAEVQDSLLVVVHDLARLDGLLAHTMDNLMQRFTKAIGGLDKPAPATWLRWMKCATSCVRP